MNILRKLLKIDKLVDKKLFQAKTTLIDDLNCVYRRMDTLEDEVECANNEVESLKRDQSLISEDCKAHVEDAITRILHPQVQIIAPNGIPVAASDYSVGYDIQASLWNIQEKFMQNAEVLRKKDILYSQIEDAMIHNREEEVEELQKQVETITEDTIQAICVHPGGHCLVPTGIFTAFDSMYRAEIVPRSGNALKKRITITNSPGTIEGDYKNEWGIIIDNEGDKDFIIKEGDKICQVIFSLVVRPQFIEVEKVEDLTGPDRGGGFGHSDSSATFL